jgi:hypothetical protein
LDEMTYNYKVVICCQKWQPCLLTCIVRHVLIKYRWISCKRNNNWWWL